MERTHGDSAPSNGVRTQRPPDFQRGRPEDSAAEGGSEQVPVCAIGHGIAHSLCHHPLLKTLTPSPHEMEEVAFIVPFREGSERITGDPVGVDRDACEVPRSSLQMLGRRTGCAEHNSSNCKSLFLVIFSLTKGDPCRGTECLWD